MVSWFLLWVRERALQRKYSERLRVRVRLSLSDVVWASRLAQLRGTTRVGSIPRLALNQAEAVEAPSSRQDFESVDVGDDRVSGRHEA